MPNRHRQCNYNKLMEVITMRFIYRSMKEMNGSGAEVKVYKGLIRRREVGMISFNAHQSLKSLGKCRIEAFRVCESERNKGIGKKMFKYIVEQAKKYGIEQIEVYPISEPYNGDSATMCSVLYTIYEHLGFIMVDSSADRNKPANKMVYIVK